MYDVEMAARLKQLGKPPARPAWYIAACVETQPLRFSIMSGQFRFEGKSLTLTATASGRTWEIGDQAAALLSGGALLVIDRI